MSLSLSKLVAGRRNPRRVKPERDAHRRLAASIRAHGLLEPLVVRPNGDDHYHVVAGRRRLEALRDIYRGKDAKVPCQVVKVDGDTAEAMSLAENFAREAMHPLEEAEAFARLAKIEGKGVDAIAAEFGVTAGYVRQRMKLATLAEPISAAYRSNWIDTATAEVFAAVPPKRQLEVWKETGKNPKHAQQVRNLIEHAWIDARHAMFDINTLPEGAVSGDLFNDRVLIDRKAFMSAQAEALITERTALAEEGWGEILIAHRDEVQDRLWSMREAEPEYDASTTRKIERIDERREKLALKLDKAGSDQAAAAIQEQLETLDEQETTLVKGAEVRYAEATKAVGTAFLILDPDGQVRREYRVPKSNGHGGRNGSNESAAAGSSSPTPVPTSDDLSERQTGATFTHEALLVREAVLADKRVRRVVLAIILHDKVRKEGLAIRQDANGTDLHAGNAEGFASKSLDALRERRNELDPLREIPGAGAVPGVGVDEAGAFDAISAMPDKQLDELINLLTVGCLTAHLIRPTPLIRLLAQRLGVDIRRHWRPDEAWLGGYKKIQLADLIGKLLGPVQRSAAEQSKKSELVARLAKLFTDAGEGRIDNPDLTAKINAWLPANLRPETTEDISQK